MSTLVTSSQLSVDVNVFVLIFRAEQLAMNSASNGSSGGEGKENGVVKGSRSFRGGSFFKKKARRAKSLNRDHWEDVVFGELKIIFFSLCSLRH